MIVREKIYLSFDEFSVLIVSALSLSFALMLFLLIIFFLLVSIEFNFKVDKNYFFMGLFFSFFLSAVDLSSKIFVTFKDSVRYGLNEISKVSIGFFLGLSLIFFSEYDELFSRIAGYSIGLVFSLFVSLFILKKHIGFFRPSFKKIINVFSHGCRVFPQMISNWVKLGADKILLSAMMPLTDLGVYSFSFAICSVAMLLGVALNNAFTPVSMSFYRSGDLYGLKKLRKKYTLIMFFFSTIFFLLVIFLKQYYWPINYDVDYLAIALFVLCFFSQTIYLFYAKYFLFKIKITLLSCGNLVVSLVYVSMLFHMADSMSVILSAALLALYSLCLMLWVVFYSILGERSMVKKISR